MHTPLSINKPPIEGVHMNRKPFWKSQSCVLSHWVAVRENRTGYRTGTHAGSRRIRHWTEDCRRHKCVWDKNVLHWKCILICVYKLNEPQCVIAKSSEWTHGDEGSSVLLPSSGELEHWHYQQWNCCKNMMKMTKRSKLLIWISVN